MKRTTEPKEPSIKASDTRCRVKNCKGTLWNVTTRLAERLGYIMLKCDKGCGTWGIPVVGKFAEPLTKLFPQRLRKIR